jgi:preprotein translocase subunit YajC
VRQIQPGTEIMTTAGIFGTIAVVTDEQLSLEISPGVFMRILPAAVARVVDPVTEDAPPVQESEGTGDVD